MKTFFIFYLARFLLLIYANPLNELDNDDTPGKVHTLYQQHYSKYKRYLKEFGKQHDSAVPEPIRLLKFAQSIKMIDEHNQRYSKGLVKYELGLNEMSDWTEEEKKKLHGYYPNMTAKVATNLTEIIGKELSRRIPSSIDYRRKITRIPVVNQGRCQVCFIFSALSTLEMYITLRNKKRAPRLSVQQVMDCSGMEKCDGKGGNDVQVLNWVAENGVTTDKYYPYKEADSISCPGRIPGLLKAKLAGGIYLPYNNEDILKKVLALYGPVAVSLHASKPDFVAYRGVAVGYGVHNGKQYFIIRNSWGPTWGKKGYGYIRAGVFMCGIGRSSAIPIFE
uniref:Papain family cysteine protease n=1 Tax=Loa loa TaxID=7209 RepID=A0A1I7VHL9_LOALO